MLIDGGSGNEVLQVLDSLTNADVGNSLDSLPAGSYVYTVTDGLCEETGSFSIQDPLKPDLIVSTSGDITCSNLTVTVEGQSSASNLSYSWTTNDGAIQSGANAAVAIVSAAGTYELTITDLNTNCSVTESVTVSAQNELPSIEVNKSGDITCNTKQVDLISTSNVNGLTYTWSTNDGTIISGANTATATVSSTGTYILTVENPSTGCSNSDTVVVNEILPPDLEVSIPETINCSNPTVELTGTSTVSGITYLWTTNDGVIASRVDLATITVSAAGTYNLTIVDPSTGCNSSKSVVVSENITTPQAIINPTQNLTCVQTSVELSTSSTGENLIYQWTTADGQINQGANNASITVSTAGTYKLMVTDTINGCFAEDSVVIQDNSEIITLNLNASSENITCDVDSITISAESSSISNLSYVWTTVDGTFASSTDSADVIISSAGTYILNVVNAITGCTAVQSITIGDIRNTPDANIQTPEQITCANPSISLIGSSVTPGVIYQWTTLDGVIDAGADQANAAVSSVGTYILTVTDTTSGCFSSTNVVVTENTQLPDVSIAPPDSITCVNTTVTLLGSTQIIDASYTWTTVDGTITSDTNQVSAIVSAAGTYTLTVIDNVTGCSNSLDVIVSENTTLPDINIAAPSQITCANPTVIITGTSTLEEAVYSWVTTNGVIDSGANTAAVTVSAVGTYTLRVTNPSTGCFVEQNVDVSEINTLPDISIATPSEITCASPTVALVGTSADTGLSYFWTTTNGVIDSGANTATATVSAAGTYTLTVTVDTTGCSSSTDVTVTASMDLPKVTIDIPGQITCSNATVTLNAHSTTANVTYLWSTTDGTINSGSNSATPAVGTAGTYTVVVTDPGTGCTSSQSVVVTANTTLPEFTISTSGSISCSESSISLITTPSDSNLTYAWTTNDGVIDSGANQSTAIVSAAGNYTLTVTDSVTGCSNMKNIIVTDQTGTPNIAILPPGSLGCHNPTVQLVGSSTTPGVTYAWTTIDGIIESGANTTTAVVSEPGIYVLTITNPATGCFSTQNMLVSGSTTIPDLNITSTGDISCIDSTVTLTANSSVSGLTYTWSTIDGQIDSGTSAANVVVSVAGTYSVIITNPQTACVNTANITINDISKVPSINIEEPAVLTCNLPTITLVGSSNLDTVTYAWTTSDGTIDSGANTASAIVSTIGTYTLTITENATGCFSTQDVVVTSAVNTPSINIAEPSLITCNNPTVSLLGSTTSEGVTHTWTTSDGTIDSGANTTSPIVSAPGTYTLIVTDTSNGCFVSQDVTVSASLDNPDLNVTIPDTITCNDPVVGITASSSNVGATFTWSTNDGIINSGANTASVQVSAAGTYTVTVTNTNNGCTTSQNVSVQAANEVPEVSLSTPDALSCITTTTSITANSSNTGLAYTWSTQDGVIDSGANTATIVVSAAGTYSLMAIDSENGCNIVKNVVVTSLVNTPAITLSEPQTITCDNPTLDITAATDISGAVYAWSTANGNILSGANTNIITVDAGGTYTLW